MSNPPESESHDGLKVDENIDLVQTGGAPTEIGRQFLALIKDPVAIDGLFEKAASGFDESPDHPESACQAFPWSDFSTAESMAMFYDCIDRAVRATGNITKETVALEMMGRTVFDSYPATEDRKSARDEWQVEVLSRCLPIKTSIGRFFCSTPPHVPLCEYIVRLQRYLKLSSPAFLVGLMLVHRAMKVPSQAVIESLYRFEVETTLGSMSSPDLTSDSISSSASAAPSTPASTLTSGSDSSSSGLVTPPMSAVEMGWISGWNQDFVHLVTLRSQHRLTLAALRAGSKIVEDLTVSNAVCAGVTGVSTPVLARLERTFYVMLNFELGYLGQSLGRELASIRRLVKRMESQAGKTMNPDKPICPEIPVDSPLQPALVAGE